MVLKYPWRMPPMIYVLWSFMFYCIFVACAEFFMFPLSYLYIVRNDNDKDDQSI